MQYNSTNIPPEIVASLPDYLQAQIPLYDETLQSRLYASAGICIVAAYAAVVLRIYARHLTRQPLGWDDYFILLSLFFTTVFVGLYLAIVATGGGRHEVVTVLENPDHVVPLFKLTLAAAVVYGPALFCTKVSILLMYHRIFPSKRFKWVCIAVGAFVASYTLTAIFTNIFHCTPVESNWDASITAHCVNLGIELVVVSSINVLTDGIILVLPMPFIWRLKTDLRRKVQLTSIFLVGMFIVVVSIIRVTYVETVSSLDGFWADSYTAMWSVTENSVGVVVACLPIMRPVFNQLIYGSPDGSRKPKGSGNYGDKLGSMDDRNIVTIGGGGGNSFQMKGLTGIHVSKSTAVSHLGTDVQHNGSYTKLVEGSQV